MKKLPKRAKRQTWFIKVRGSYLPNSWQAWALYVPFVTFLFAVLGSAIQDQTSVSAVFYAVFPQWVAAAVVMTWLAAQKS